MSDHDESDVVLAFAHSVALLCSRVNRRIGADLPADDAEFFLESSKAKLLAEGIECI
eukprot:COSAG05_NODE_15687_length_364_cov_0.505660_2_plen_56_part_01